jgi:glycosyltransferase involved in cell wall biosynthesis
MKISIAMATYNGEKYILEQLESFNKQSILPDELVITDDCSTDNTLEIINKFKKVAPFKVRVYSNEKNLGYAQNFNKAMQLCTNDLIFLSDQDDVWFPTKIEYMLNLAVQYPDKDLFMIDTELTDINLKESGLTKQGQIRGLGLNESAFVMGCCIAVKKRYLDLILPIPKGFSGHDDWIVNIADILNLRYIDSSIQQYYRIHGNNTSTFIANRLVKTEKLEITFRQNILNLLSYSKSTSFSHNIYLKSCLLIPLGRLSKNKQYARLAESEIIRLKRDIRSYEKRLDVISSKNIVIRIVNALKLYINGGYTAFSGFKSFISDIFCP